MSVCKPVCCAAMAALLAVSPLWAGTPGGTSTFMPLGPEAASWTDGESAAIDGLRLQSLGSSEAGTTKNPRLAMLYSLLLPGLGELYLGNHNRAAGFFAAEAGIWATNFYFNNQADVRKRRYKEYAEAEAGVAPRDDDEYYRQLGIYMSSDGPRGANETVRRQARARYPNDREAQDAYVEQYGYFGGDAWIWESASAFDEYGRLRELTLDSEEKARLTIGLMVANRLLSVVDVGLLSRNLSLGDSAELSWDVHVGPKGPNARVALSRAF